jgi:L-ascorbate metabolism protein UlaG (beta-lactamase superfamily)
VCVLEVNDLGEVDLAFISVILPYTMPPEEAMGCVKAISPGVMVPYHQGEYDPQVWPTPARA